ncbi:class I SAM-dependent DNA methyltransferase [Alkalihalobacillus sp. NPDC078783]
MNYTGFASLYDYLMADAPYAGWLEFVKESVQGQPLHGLKFIDVGCGTGELLLLMLKQGMNGTGLDLSPEMLTVARAKAEEEGFSPLLIEADMTSLPKLDEYDLVTVFCDSLNYLRSADDVQLAIAGFAQQLKKNGLLLFDVHSEYKINEEFVGQTFADADEDVSYIWNSFSGVEPNSVEHELSFFAKTEFGHYERTDELHVQKTFSIDQYCTWLQHAGFKVVSVTADFTQNEPTDKSERIFFKAIKL